MNKTTDIVYKIIDHVLAPPFRITNGGRSVFNRYSKDIGCYVNNDYFYQELYLEQPICWEFDSKITLVFGVNYLPKKDVTKVAKHVFLYLQDNFPEKVSSIVMGLYGLRVRYIDPNLNHNKP